VRLLKRRWNICLKQLSRIPSLKEIQVYMLNKALICGVAKERWQDKLVSS